MCLNRSVKRSGSSTLYVHYIHGEHSRSRGDSLSTWLQKYQRVLANSRPGRQNADKLVSYPGGGGGGGGSNTPDRLILQKARYERDRSWFL